MTFVCVYIVLKTIFVYNLFRDLHLRRRNKKMAVEKISKRKIMLIGTGFVGMSFAYSL